MARVRSGVCLLLGLATACATDPGDDPGGKTSGTANTPAAIAGLAKSIYDAVDAGEDLTPWVQGVFEAFDIPVLAPDDIAGAQARIDAGLPLVTSILVTRMAEAYAQGGLVDATGFVEGLVEQGVGLAYPYDQSGEALNADILGTLIYSYTIAGEYEPDVPLEPGYRLPTLVRALGQERARRRSPGSQITDLAWGDGRLDPLQFTLLLHTILSKPATGSRGPQGLRAETRFANPAVGFIKDQIEDKITSAVQDVVEVPLDKKDAAKLSVCGSLILYGHKISMTNTPNTLWHAPKAPNVTAVQLTLTFEDDYYDNWARAVLGSAVTDLTGCKFPRKGPIEGKPIEWDVSDALKPHGSYDLTQPITDDVGKALASWRTVADDLPPACQVFEKQRDAVGATEAVISNLLPGWSTVERVVTFLNPATGGQGNAALTVLYYEVAADDPCHAQ